MRITHNNKTYECAVAVKCENDRYIKLYDAAGNEIVSFNGISDFSKYEISGGTFVDPCDCEKPIALSSYAIGGRTITTDDWILAEDNTYYYEIESNLISANTTTCNVLLLFAQGTELDYSATQEEGRIVLHTEAAPLYNVVIDSIQITTVPGVKHSINLLSFPYLESSKIDDGIEWVVNEDRSVTANGTNETNGQNIFSCRTRTETESPLILKAGTYTVKGCPIGGSTNSYYIQVGRTVKGAYYNLGIDIGNGTTFTLTEDAQIQIQLVVANLYTVENITFKPCLYAVA